MRNFTSSLKFKRAPCLDRSAQCIAVASISACFLRHPAGRQLHAWFVKTYTSLCPFTWLSNSIIYVPLIENKEY